MGVERLLVEPLERVRSGKGKRSRAHTREPQIGYHSMSI